MVHLGLPYWRVNEERYDICRRLCMEGLRCNKSWIKITRHDEISGMHVRIDRRGRKIGKH